MKVWSLNCISYDSTYINNYIDWDIYAYISIYTSHLKTSNTFSKCPTKTAGKKQTQGDVKMPFQTSSCRRHCKEYSKSLRRTTMCLAKSQAMAVFFRRCSSSRCQNLAIFFEWDFGKGSLGMVKTLGWIGFPQSGSKKMEHKAWFRSLEWGNTLSPTVHQRKPNHFNIKPGSIRKVCRCA